MTTTTNTSLTLKDLPSPPPEKSGWPWTEQSHRIVEKMPDETDWPRITIVTPNYNYGEFIEETIRSVLLQGYPNLEYIIIDGGSTDNSVEIIKKYDKWLSYWVSENDQGQSNAINKGLSMATGEWFNWLNSDDLLMPNSLINFAKISRIVAEAKWISGGRIEMNKNGEFCDICIPWRTDPIGIGLGVLYLPQDATFVRVDFMKNHQIDIPEEFSIVFDTVFHNRLLQHYKPVLTSAIFSGIRRHDINKTLDCEKKYQESVEGIWTNIKQLSFTRRLLHRLVHTRLNHIVRAILFLGVRYGIIPYSRDWKAVVFDRKTAAFKIVPAHRTLLGI